MYKGTFVTNVPEKLVPRRQSPSQKAASIIGMFLNSGKKCEEGNELNSTYEVRYRDSQYSYLTENL